MPLRVLACLRTAAVFGVEACPVQVEVDVSFGLPGFTMVGLPDASVRESRDRVRSAIRNSGFEFPPHRITVNLAPADVRKAGASFDLPIALGVLAAQGVVERRHVADLVVLGELSLDGSIHATRGVLPIAAAARREGLAGILLPIANAGEAVVVSGLDVFPVASLADAVRALNQPATCAPAVVTPRAGASVRRRRSGRRARATARAPRARGRVGGRPQPAPRRTAGSGQDDDRATRARHSAAAHLRGSDRSDGRALRRRPAAAGRRTARRSAVSRAASHDFGGCARRRRDPSRAPAKSASPITACSFSTRCSSSAGTCSRCSASRSKRAGSRSRARPAPRSSPPDSCSWPR